MLNDEFFRGRVSVHLTYASSRPAAEAVQILERRLSDDSFEQYPLAWLNALESVRQPEHAADAQRLRSAAAARLQRGDVGATAHAALPVLIGHDSIEPTDATALIGWFIAKAGPGDASLACDLLEHRIVRRPQGDPFRPILRPLSGWLLRNGAAEIRTRRRAALLVAMALDFFASDDVANAVTALRFLVVSEAPLTMRSLEVAGNDHGSMFLQLLGAIAASDRRLVVDVIEQFDEGLYEEVGTAALEQGEPLTSTIMRALFEGRVANGCWRTAFRVGDPPEDVRFARRQDCLHAVRALSDDALSALATGGATPDARVSAWARVLAAELLRITDVLRDGASDIDAVKALSMLIVEPSKAMMSGVYDALLSVARATDGALASDVATLLQNGGARSSRAVVELLRTAPPSVATTTARHIPWDVIRAFIEHPWLERIGGVYVPRLLAGTRRVAPAKLSNDDKVQIDGDALLVDEGELLDAIMNVADGDDRRALAALYFVHELAHLEQAIGKKSLVVALRARGAEASVMHLDLAADHLAALLVSHVFSRWSLEHLKDLQGRGLSAFPAGPRYTSAARGRKAVRLVSLRLDWLLRSREATLAERIGEGYVFSDFGPGEGPIFALCSGPPLRVLSNGRLAAEEATVLARAADEGSSCSAIDAVLCRAFGLEK